jgi:hypothetical protein
VVPTAYTLLARTHRAEVQDDGEPVAQGTPAE